MIKQNHPPFDVFQVPLQGTTLIEASAGTGKTHTITGLCLRLLLETGRAVERILVVTYTQAATAELKTRLRERLSAVKSAFLTGQAGDPFVQALLDRREDRQAAVTAIESALRDFDEAAIYTIHGFCHRVLSDSAFESRRPFHAEVIPDEREVLEEIVRDFWRREFYGASRLFVAYLLEQGYGPDKLLSLVSPHVGKPFLKVEGPMEAPECQAVEAAYEVALMTVRRIWSESRSEVVDLLMSYSGLNRSSYKTSSLPGWCVLMDAFLQAKAPSLRAFDQLDKFTARSLINAVKKGHEPPEHPFFHACGALLEARDGLRVLYGEQLRFLTRRLLDEANAQLESRKERLRVQSYNDLLLHLERALSSPGGAALAKTIRERYSVALIDEFQDTDPLQYRIFRSIFGGPSTPLVVVGDPKQAIYSFRGADVFAYLKGRADADRTYPLDVNWRSDPPLIRAVNALFFRPKASSFVFDQIRFEPARPAQKDRESLTVAEDGKAPFTIWFLGRGEDGKPIPKGVAGETAARITAAEIARLLHLTSQDRASLGGRRLHGGDIAVLVRTHRQGQWVRDALRRLGVATVELGAGSVFETREAMELYRVLLAVAEPYRESHIKAALATEMLGVAGEAIHALGEDETAWEIYQEEFHAYHRLWRDHGFMRMVRQLLEHRGVPGRLLSHADGERRLTNLLHLTELLQAQAVRNQQGPEGLLQWFSGQRLTPSAADEEALLRLESDENLVRIVTVHKSKGLEYPIVFCPFFWDGRVGTDGKEAVLYHDPSDEYRAVLDIGSTRQEEARGLARQEAFAENLRLLYVALTRARHRCYLLWGAIREADCSALAWLLHPPETAAPDPIGQLRKHMEGLSDEAMHADLEELVKKSDGAIRVEEAPDLSEEFLPWREEQPVTLSARRFTRVIPAGWRVTSFSALTAGQAADLPDFDAGVHGREAAVYAGGERTMFTFPRGAASGRCLHAIFEGLDFTRGDRPALETLVRTKLLEHAIDPAWIGTVADQIERVLASPLDEEGRIRLNEVTNSRRLNELEFYYPLERLEAKGLKDILGQADWGYPAATRDLIFSPVAGFMKGYIDLAFEAGGRFYLLDYKSNWLGMNHEDYHRSRLPAVMSHEGYYLQYLVYAVALHRYLERRLPAYDYETHFGGVFYLFLRGMDPARGQDYGVFRDRPERDLVERLDAYFSGRQEPSS